MRISPISNCQPNFKGVVIKPEVQEYIDNMSDDEKSQVNDIIAKAENTKHWDLVANFVMPHGVSCDFVNKQDPNNVHRICASPFAQNLNRVKISSILGQEESRIEELEFPTVARANDFVRFEQLEVNKYSVRKNYRPTFVESLTRKVNNLLFLDEAYEHMSEKYPDGKIPKWSNAGYEHISLKTQESKKVVKEESTENKEQKTPLIDRILAKLGLQRVK